MVMMMRRRRRRRMRRKSRKAMTYAKQRLQNGGLKRTNLLKEMKAVETPIF